MEQADKILLDECRSEIKGFQQKLDTLRRSL